MRSMLIALASIPGLLGVTGCAAPAASPLFDGRTLGGWTQRGGKAEYRVEDEAIVGATRPNQPNSFLCTNETFADFILELEFKIDPELNSGVQIRSESRPDYRDGVVHGYQVEIDPSARGWTAGIYDEQRRGWLAPADTDTIPRGVLRPGDWNDLRVEARGPRIRTWLNDVPIADLTDDMTPSGFIGLQVHGVGAREDELTVRWRNIRIRRLKAGR